MFFYLYLSFFLEHSRITDSRRDYRLYSLTSHCKFHPLHRHFNISQAVTAESSPLHISKYHPLCEFREISTVEYISLQTVFFILFKCFDVWIAIDSTTDIFLWTSCFSTILSHCRVSPWYQVQSKTVGTEIMLISETWG